MGEAYEKSIRVAVRNPSTHHKRERSVSVHRDSRRQLEGGTGAGPVGKARRTSAGERRH